MEILHVQLVKDGMDMAVSLFLALQDLFIMVHNVFAQNCMINVCHGNTLMDKNVYTLKTLAPEAHDGIKVNVFLLMTALLDIMEKRTNANHSLKNACLQQPGVMVNAKYQDEIAL